VEGATNRRELHHGEKRGRRVGRRKQEKETGEPLEEKIQKGGKKREQQQLETTHV
jgi:hypothetical protein